MPKHLLRFLCSVAICLGIQWPAMAQFAAGTLSYKLSITSKVSWAFYEQAGLGESNGSWGANAQMELSYQQSRRLAVGIGVKYSFDQLEGRNYTPIFACDIDPVSGPDVFNSWFEDRYSASYVGIPISFRYFLGGTRAAVYTKLGYDFLFRVNADQKSVLWACGASTLTIGEPILDAFNRNASKLSLGFGAVFGAEENELRFFVEPEIAYWLTRVFQEDNGISSLPNNIRLLDVGLKTGIYF